MIFVSKDRTDAPLFTGYVNKIWERELPNNGGTIHTYSVGTRERLPDHTKRYSTWSCELIGAARRKAESAPLQEGDRIAVYSMKMTNISKKTEEGKWGKPFLHVYINDYDVDEPNTSGIPDTGIEEDLAY